ncbi:MAG: tripartite tricarboxylate transporter permease [Proteobacteria bacterium]|nr:tripartite tricarboxylate transporter permease [Pseudomonadota bacterium]
MLDGILLGLQTVLTINNLFLVFTGCATGTLIGMLPGLGPISAIALMIPVTYGFDPASGMILLAGVYYGAIFGGSTSSILINAPGVAGTVATAFDGYPLARSGHAGKALATAVYSSFAGGTLATLFLVLAAPILADLSLGILGSGTTAVLLGALIAYGIQPGPRLIVDEPEIFWSVIVSMYFGNVILLILNLPLIPYIARLLTIPRQFLIPMIMFFSLMGVYLVSFNTFDLQMMVVIAAIATMLRLLGFPMAPLLLGFILGGMLEDNLRRAVTLSDGELSFLWDRPTTLVLLILTTLVLLSPLARFFLTRLVRGRGNL